MYKNSLGVVQLYNWGLLFHVTRNVDMRHHPNITTHPSWFTSYSFSNKKNTGACHSAINSSSVKEVSSMCWHLSILYRLGAFSFLRSLKLWSYAWCWAAWRLLLTPSETSFSPVLTLSRLAFWDQSGLIVSVFFDEIFCAFFLAPNSNSRVFAVGLSSLT